MLGRMFLGLSVAAGLWAVAPMASAQAQTILVESGPSDNPQYRRMIFVKYLNGDRISANYRTYSRSEFQQVPNTTPAEVLSACANGSATRLSEIKSFEKAERRRESRGEAPEITRFCIKNVSGWDSGQKDIYLDPIFNGLPLGPKTF